MGVVVVGFGGEAPVGLNCGVGGVRVRERVCWMETLGRRAWSEARRARGTGRRDMLGGLMVVTRVLGNLSRFGRCGDDVRDGVT